MWYGPTGKEKRHQGKQNPKNSSPREARGRPRGTLLPSKEFCDTLYVEEASKRRVGPFSLLTIYVLVVERAREACLPRSDFTSPSALQPQRFGICHGASLPGAGARLR